MEEKDILEKASKKHAIIEDELIKLHFIFDGEMYNAMFKIDKITNLSGLEYVLNDELLEEVNKGDVIPDKIKVDGENIRIEVSKVGVPYVCHGTLKTIEGN